MSPADSDIFILFGLRGFELDTDGDTDYTEYNDSDCTLDACDDCDTSGSIALGFVNDTNEKFVC